MLEYIILLVLSLAMAKRSGRSFSLRGVRYTPSLALSTLGSATALTSAIYGNADGVYRIMSLSSVWALRGHTGGEGPLHVGYAHGDYTVTEIKEFMESASAISIGNKILNEQANRQIRHVGTFNGLLTEEVLNDGKPIKTRLNWAIPIGVNLNMFLYNDSGAALTTGSIVDCTGKGWVKDY